MKNTVSFYGIFLCKCNKNYWLIISGKSVSICIYMAMASFAVGCTLFSVCKHSPELSLSAFKTNGLIIMVVTPLSSSITYVYAKCFVKFLCQVQDLFLCRQVSMFRPVRLFLHKCNHLLILLLRYLCLRERRLHSRPYPYLVLL